MMKKLIVLAVVALVFGIVSGAYASETDWLIYFKATDEFGSNGITSNFIYGVRSIAQDGVDGQDAANTAGTGSAVVLACFDLGPGAANNGYYKDIRLTQPQTWNLKLWVQAGFNKSQIKLSGWNPSGSYDLLPPGYKLTAPAYGLSFVFDGNSNGTSTAPQFTWTFNASLHRGVENAVLLTLAPVEEQPPIPEPGSIVALASGLVGLVGFGIRRRK